MPKKNEKLVKKRPNTSLGIKCYKLTSQYAEKIKQSLELSNVARITLAGTIYTTKQ